MRRAVTKVPALVLLAALFASCALKTVKTETFGDPASRRAVLLAYDYSDFKADVAGRVMKDLTGDGYRVRVTDVSHLSGESAEPYGAVVLMAPLVVWQLDKNVRDFIEKSPDKARIILVTTAGGPDWKADIKGVDAVTEASVLSDAEALAHTVTGKVRALFEP